MLSRGAGLVVFTQPTLKPPRPPRLRKPLCLSFPQTFREGDTEFSKRVVFGPEVLREVRSDVTVRSGRTKTLGPVRTPEVSTPTPHSPGVRALGSLRPGVGEGSRPGKDRVSVSGTSAGTPTPTRIGHRGPGTLLEQKQERTVLNILGEVVVEDESG